MRKAGSCGQSIECANQPTLPYVPEAIRARDVASNQLSVRESPLADATEPQSLIAPELWPASAMNSSFVGKSMPTAERSAGEQANAKFCLLSAQS